MPDDDIIKSIVEKTNILDRRVSTVEQSMSKVESELRFVIKELEDNKHAQLRTCDTMINTRNEVVGMLNIIKDSQHSMQIESTILKTSIESDRTHRTENKADGKWLTNVLMALPSLLISFAAIFAAIQLKGVQ